MEDSIITYTGSPIRVKVPDSNLTTYKKVVSKGGVVTVQPFSIEDHTYVRNRVGNYASITPVMVVVTDAGTFRMAVLENTIGVYGDCGDREPNQLNWAVCLALLLMAKRPIYAAVRLQQWFAARYELEDIACQLRASRDDWWVLQTVQVLVVTPEGKDGR